MINSLLAGLLGIFLTIGSWFGISNTSHLSHAATSTPATLAATSSNESASGSNTNTVAAATMPAGMVLDNSNSSSETSGNSSVTSAPSDTTVAGLPIGSPWLSVLPLGDGKYSTSGPKKGYVYLCNVASGGEGTEVNGPWIQGNVWYPGEKTSVQGTITWPNAMVHISVSGALRTIISNDLPVGMTTGIFPIQSSDPAYAYDRNPNSIEAQNISISLPANPTVAAAPSCIYGEVGIMTNGVLLLDAFDAEYRDAEAHEMQDSCSGHPHQGGMYHYHSLSACIDDIDETNVIGYAFDGFPITGPKLPNGNYLTTSDLDECHGITSPIVEDGKTVTTYHYVMTEDFPYSVGCFRGKSYEPQPGMSSGGSMSGMSGMSDESGGGAGAQGASATNGPPQAAITACASSGAGDSCTVDTPNGTISGTCKTPPNSSSLACIPTN